MADEKYNPNGPYGHNESTKNVKSWDVRESKVLPDDASTKGRVDLNPQDFDNLIDQKGMNCKVFRTMYCPNVKSVDGAEHQIDCPLCNSSGFIDFDPIKTKVFVQTQELDKLPHVEGFVDGNTVMMTFKIGIELQYFTRIELTDFTNIYFQRVLRNPNSDVDVLQYKACRVNALIDADGVRYYPDTDFKIDLNGSIKWNGGVQTRLIQFTQVPTNGTWDLHIGQNEAGPFDPTLVAADLEAALRGATGYSDITVTGDYFSGFTVSLVNVSGLVGEFWVDSELSVGPTSVFGEVTSALVGGRHPDSAKPYSIHYEAPQQFRAHAASHVNRYSQFKSNGAVEYLKFQEQWYCAKEFMPKRKDRQGNELQQGPYDNHTIVTEDDNE